MGAKIIDYCVSGELNWAGICLERRLRVRNGKRKKEEMIGWRKKRDIWLREMGRQKKTS